MMRGLSQFALLEQISAVKLRKSVDSKEIPTSMALEFDLGYIRR